MTDIIPVERLTSHGQFFRCVPLSSTLAARACLKRQKARADGRVGTQPLRWPTCAACPLGAQVADQLKDVTDDGQGPTVTLPQHPTAEAQTMKTTTCEHCKKHETSPVTARTPKGTETWCKHCRRVASMKAAGKGFGPKPATTPVPAQDVAGLGERVNAPMPFPEATPEQRREIERLTDALKAPSGGRIRVKVFVVECDADQCDAVALMLGEML